MVIFKAKKYRFLWLSIKSSLLGILLNNYTTQDYALVEVKRYVENINSIQFNYIVDKNIF